MLDNLGIKLVSLAVAIALAVYVRGEKTALSDFKVKVQYILDEDRILTSPPQGELTVRFKGPEALLNHLEQDDLPPLSIALEEQESGQLCFEYRTDKLPPSFRSLDVQEIIPRCIPLTLERRVEKEVPIVADVLGTPEQGYSLGAATVVPARVSIYGAESAVAGIRQVRTEPVSVSRAVEDVKTTVPLVPFAEGTHVWYSAKTLPKAEVTVEIIPQSVEKTIRSVRILPATPVEDGTYTLLPDKVDLVVYGPKPTLESLDAQKLYIEADLAEVVKLASAKASRSAVTFRLELSRVVGLPPEVSAINFRPSAEVKLYLQREEPPK